MKNGPRRKTRPKFREEKPEGLAMGTEIPTAHRLYGANYQQIIKALA
jgi:hypothetical protein